MGKAGDHLHMYLYKINQPDRGTDLQSISGEDKNIFVPILEPDATYHHFLMLAMLYC